MDEFGEFIVFWGDIGGVVFIYFLGGGILVVSVWVLFLILFVVFELTRGLSRGIFWVV